MSGGAYCRAGGRPWRSDKVPAEVERPVSKLVDSFAEEVGEAHGGLAEGGAGGRSQRGFQRGAQ